MHPGSIPGAASSKIPNKISILRLAPGYELCDMCRRAKALRINGRQIGSSGATAHGMAQEAHFSTTIAAQCPAAQIVGEAPVQRGMIPIPKKPAINYNIKVACA